MSVRIISFYLPQFYPFPENDEWWGKGFTEWTNVTKARPLFEGHYQPHLPTDMGFYDLRVRETQHEQIKLAKNYGIYGFCFHYYWFDGKRLLEKPVDTFLTDPQADMPFCLCWANENWTRRWDAAEREVLIAQSYSPGWEERFVDGLVPFFGDKRYIRVDGKPLLIVYRPQHIPDARLAGQRWRRYCREIGVGEIHIVSALTHGNDNYEQYDFDAGVEFPPHNMRVSSVNEIVPTYAPYNGYAVEYAEVAAEYIRRNHTDRVVYRTVFPSWDNTARTRDRALIVLGATVENYERWLKQAVSRTKEERSGTHQLVFVNAWNEWAEGCHLEPDREFGRGFLEATLRVKQGFSTVGGNYELSPLRKAAAKVSEPAPVPGRIALKWKVAAYLHNRPLALSVVRRIYRVAVGFARLSRRAFR